MSNSPFNETLIGSTVEWTQDLRPTPDTCYLHDEAASMDMSLVTQEQGVVQGISRGLLGSWVALVAHNGHLVELPVTTLKIVKPKKHYESPY